MLLSNFPFSSLFYSYPYSICEFLVERCFWSFLVPPFFLLLGSHFGNRRMSKSRNKGVERITNHMWIGAEGGGLTTVSGTISTETNRIEFIICERELCELSPIQTIESIPLLYSPKSIGIKDIFQVDSFEIAIFVFDYHNYLFPTFPLNLFFNK